MPAPSVTYVFANSTTADATQVNTNFNDLIAGMTDGTKDFSINALTVAGVATLNGNITLGNASSDDLTVTASLASNLSVKTTNTYDFGSSTIAMRSMYFASADGAARTTRIIGATIGASYTLTLPTAVPSQTKQFMVSDASGNLAFQYLEPTTAKTANYTATGVEGVILCDATAGAFTITLPAAASFANKTFYIKKTDAGFNAVTIDANGTETIDGALTTALSTQYESIRIVSDGTNWHVIARKTTTNWIQYTPTFANAGTVGANHSFFWRRNGDSIEIRGSFKAPTPAAGTLTVTLPGGWSVDSAKYAQLGNRAYAGTYNVSDGTGGNGVWLAGKGGVVTVQNGDFTKFEFNPTNNTDNTSSGPYGSGANGNSIFNVNGILAMTAIVPISGWSA